MPANRLFRKSAIWMVALIWMALLACSVSAASAETPSPWFHLASVSRPGVLPGTAKDEVQDVTVTGPPGEPFVLSNLTAKEVKEIEEGRPLEKTAFLAVGDEPSAIQTGLEEIYGAGNVAVSGGPGVEVGLEPYEVTFKKALADRPVEPINTEFNSAVTVNVGQVVMGRPEGEIAVTAINLGDVAADGKATPVKITDRLPSGLSASFVEGNTRDDGGENGPVDCVIASSDEAQCTFAHSLPPYSQIEVAIGVGVEPQAASGELNEVSVSGGGAPDALLNHPITVAKQAGEATPFGVEHYEQTFEEVGGTPDAQAGSHPFQFTTTLDLNQDSEGEPAGALAKDLTFKLPAGVIGNPTAYPRCTLAQFSTIVNPQANECPTDTVLGIAVVSYQNHEAKREETATTPIFNLEPSVGEPARFGLQPAGIPVFLDTSVRTGEDYGVTAHVENITQLVGFLANTVTFWGVPGDSRHDNIRGSGCLAEADGVPEEERIHNGIPPCIHLNQSSPPRS